MGQWQRQTVIIIADMGCGMGCSESIICGKVGGSLVLLVGGGIPEVASGVLLHPLAVFTLGLSEQYKRAFAPFLKLLPKWGHHVGGTLSEM